MTRTPFKIFILITLSLLASALGNPSAEEASANAASQIHTKQVPAGKLVFVNHQGPYWHISRTIESLTTYMKQNHQDGPILIRYEGQPQSQQFSSRVRIGFPIRDDHEPQSPYELIQDQAMLVAYATIAVGSLSPSRSYAYLSEWAQAHELDIVGPFTEIYAYPRKDEAAESATVEVQLGVRKKPQQILSAKNVTDLAETAIEPEKVSVTDATKPKTLANEIKRSTADQVMDDLANQPTTSDNINESSASIEPISPDTIETPANDQPLPQEIVAMFDPIVDLLFTKFCSGDDSANYTPLAKLISRIQAIAQGADQRYPGQALPLKKLAELMSARLAMHQPLTAEAARPNEQLRQATNKLEVVMVGIGYRTISPSQALVRALTILREAVEVSTNIPASHSTLPETP